MTVLLVDTLERITEPNVSIERLFEIIALTGGPEAVVMWDRDVMPQLMKPENDGLIAGSLHDGDAVAHDLVDCVRVYFFDVFSTEGEPRDGAKAGAIYLRADQRWFWVGRKTKPPPDRLDPTGFWQVVGPVDFRRAIEAVRALR